MKRRTVLLSSMVVVVAILAAVLLPAGGALLIGDKVSAADGSGEGQQVRFVDSAMVAYMLFYYGTTAPPVSQGAKATAEQKSTGYTYSDITPPTRIAPYRAEYPLRTWRAKPTPPPGIAKPVIP